MTIDLDALEALARKATAGRWVVFHADEDGANDVLPAMRPGHIALDIKRTEDARFIAACDPQTILELIERARSNG